MVVFTDRNGNFEPPPEPERNGPGEAGKPHRVPSNKENDAMNSMNEYGMNMAVSDEISLDRSIPDLRMGEYVFFLSVIDVS